jgi:hypothetical protein
VVLSLLATLTPAAGGRTVSVRVPVPETAGRDSSLLIHGISAAGQPLTLEGTLPAELVVVTGMLAPLRLEGAASEYSSTAAITSAATLYAPRIDSPDVLVFSADGTPLPSLPVASIGLSENTRFAAFDEATSTLLLADAKSTTSKLVAVDELSRTVRWSTGLEDSCLGLAVLPAQGLVVTSDYSSDELRVHRLADGTLVDSQTAADPKFISSDPVTSSIYVSAHHKVCSFRWSTKKLLPGGFVEAAGNTGHYRPLAVVPATPGKHTSYLVVGTYGAALLLVLSLPDCRLVHTHALEGLEVMGLAADPSGTTLAVCDRASKAVHVLMWPLPGMPSLQ